MKMIEDTPDELLGELLNCGVLPRSTLSDERGIEGTVETVSNFDHEKTSAFHAQNYAPANLVIAADGNVNHQQFVDLALKFFGGSNGHEEKGFSARGTRPCGSDFD